jgi:uncharacterized membrane protein required for colicin V production
MWLDALALVLLGLFAGLGAMRGGLAAGLALATLVAAYAAALALGPVFAQEAAELSGTPEWVGLALAGTAAALAVLVAMSLISFGVRRLEGREPGEPRSLRDRFAGSVFGAARGALVVLLLSYLALWVDALRATGTVADLPELGPSAAAAVTGSLVEAGLEAAAPGPAGRAMARVAARPNRTLVELQELIEAPALVELRSDAAFWNLVETGAFDQAMNRRGFLALSHDAHLRARLGELGLIGEDAVADVAAFRVEARRVLSEVGPRLRQLREDPALEDLMRDPDVMAAVQSGDHFALIRHPEFRAVVTRALETPAP